MDRLYGTALRLARNRADAEDTVAEALAKAWASLFVSYDPIVEAAGFALLLGAVALDLYLIYRAECFTERRDK